MQNNGIVVLGAILLIGGIIWIVSSSSAVASPVAMATLAARNGSGISGTVSFVPTSDGQSTSVTTRLTGLQPDAVYSVTIHNGSCLGPRLFILSGVVGSANGQGSSTTTVPAQPDTYWAVAVHATASPDSPLVACGQVHVTGTVSQPGERVPVENEAPYQLPNGGGAPPRMPIPTPVAGH
jgi:hypothetical protein